MGDLDGEPALPVRSRRARRRRAGGRVRGVDDAGGTQMWMTIISFIGGPVIKGLIDGYKAKLAAGNTSEKIASETASAEIAAQISDANAITQYRIAEIRHWYEPDKLMGYFGAV